MEDIYQAVLYRLRTEPVLVRCTAAVAVVAAAAAAGVEGEALAGVAAAAIALVGEARRHTRSKASEQLDHSAIEDHGHSG